VRSRLLSTVLILHHSDAASPTPSSKAADRQQVLLQFAAKSHHNDSERNQRVRDESQRKPPGLPAMSNSRANTNTWSRRRTISAAPASPRHGSKHLHHHRRVDRSERADVPPSPLLQSAQSEGPVQTPRGSSAIPDSRQDRLRLADTSHQRQR